MSEQKTGRLDTEEVSKEVIELDVPCVCGCGEETRYFHKGAPFTNIPVPLAEFDCYDRWKTNMEWAIQQRSYRNPIDIQMVIVKNDHGRHIGSIAQLLGSA